LRFKVGRDLRASESVGKKFIRQAMSDVTPRSPSASEAVVPVSRDQLTAAAGVKPDQGGSQAQTHC